MRYETKYCNLCNIRVSLNPTYNIKTQLCESCLEEHVSGQMRDFSN